jgi:hypothetical protein
MRIRIPNTAANRTGLFQIGEMLRRRRSLGFVHWITDPDPGPILFVSSCQDAKKFKVFLKIVFCLLFTTGTFTLVFKDNKSFRSYKTEDFPNYFAFRNDPIRTNQFNFRSHRKKY